MLFEIIDFVTKELINFINNIALKIKIYFIVMILETLIRGNNVPGYPSIICLILILGGINLLAIGIVGEYISKIYLEIKKRPIYITKNTLGFDEDVL